MSINHWFLYAAILCVLVSYISSLRSFRLDMPLIYRQFSFFLLFVLMGELFAMAWSKWIYLCTPFGQSNQWFYNPFHMCSYLFYLYFFYIISRTARIRQIIKLLAIVYFLFAACNLFIQGSKELNTYTSLLSAFMMVFLSISYYYQMLNEKEVVPLRSNMAFWISTGLLICHLASSMSTFLINVAAYYSTAAALKIHLIVMLAAMAMYLTYTIGYLCQRKQSSGKH
jgi:hypothetical protein